MDVKRGLAWGLTTSILVIVGTTTTCSKRVGIPKDPVADDLRKIVRAVDSYFDAHEEMPTALGELYPDHLQDKEVLVYSGIPVVPGSNPPTTYRYVPCRYHEQPDRIVVYVNQRGRPGQYPPLLAVTLSGAVMFMSPEEFEKAIRDLGEDYDSLPIAGEESRQ